MDFRSDSPGTLKRELQPAGRIIPLESNFWMALGCRSRGVQCIALAPIPRAHRSAGGPRPQHVARSRWSGAFLSLSTSYAAADRDGPRSGGGFKMRLIPLAANSTNPPIENTAPAGLRKAEGYGQCHRRSFYSDRGETMQPLPFVVSRNNSCAPKP